MKVAILGAGHGGQAMAADLSLSGHQVRLAAVPEHSSNLLVIKSFGGIYLEGLTSSGLPAGFAKLDLVTDNIRQAIEGVDVIMIVVPAFAQKPYMDILIEHAEPGQIVVFNPGKFACLEFERMLAEAGREGELKIGETSSLIYAAKTRGPGCVRIKAVKSELYFAALPSVQTAPVLMEISELFTQFVPAYNVLQTSLDDIGMTLHTITTLMNTSRIEQMGPYRNSHYDITPSVGRVLEAVDNERLNVAKTLRCEALTFMETYRAIYGITGKNAYEILMSVDAYKVQMAPESLNHRYITEEIPFGLVPTSSIAEIAGVDTPGINAFIDIGSFANGVDYRREGRNMKKFGLDKLDITGLIKHVMEGNTKRISVPVV